MDKPHLDYGVTMRWFMLFFSFECFAFGVSPMAFEVKSVGPSSQKKVTVINKFTTQLDIEVIPYLLEWKEGSYRYEEKIDDFLILPDTASIEPGESRVILIQYFGEPEVNKSKAYAVKFKQVSTNNSKNVNGTNVNMTVDFNSIMTVLPNKISSELAVSSVIKKSDDRWTFTVDNSGNKHEWASTYNWIVTTKSGQVSLSGKDLSTNVDNKFFPPQSSVQVLFDSKDLIDGEVLNIDIKDIN